MVHIGFDVCLPGFHVIAYTVESLDDGVDGLFEDIPVLGKVEVGTTLDLVADGQCWTRQ